VLDKTIAVRKIIRRMKGGSQSRLVEGEDRAKYVMKCFNNPQGVRTLINEVIASHVFRQLNINVPELQILDLSEEVLRASEFPTFAVGKKNVPLVPGCHLGSKCPVDLDKTAVFEFLPVRLLDHVVNVADLGRTYIVDRLYCNHDTRQVIFTKCKRAPALAFKAFMIDNGYFFGGAQWYLYDTTTVTRRPIYFDNMFDPALLTDNADVLKFLVEFASTDWQQLLRAMPPQWLRSENVVALNVVQKKLIKGLPSMIGNLEREWDLLAKMRSRSLPFSEKVPHHLATGILAPAAG
jgi:hypothetical protein